MFAKNKNRNINKSNAKKGDREWERYYALNDNRVQPRCLSGQLGRLELAPSSCCELSWCSSWDHNNSNKTSDNHNHDHNDVLVSSVVWKSCFLFRWYEKYYLCSQSTHIEIRDCHIWRLSHKSPTNGNIYYLIYNNSNNRVTTSTTAATTLKVTKQWKKHQKLINNSNKFWNQPPMLPH